MKNLAEKRGLTLAAKRRLTGVAFSLPAILGMAVFFLIPFAITIYYSFTNSIASGTFVGLDNYASVLGSSTFRLAALNTLKFNAIAVPLIMVISLFIALVLHKKLKGFSFFRAAFIFPLVLPTASVILFFQIIFSDSGAVNAVLRLLGIPVSNWLNSPNAFIVLVVLYIWKNCGYNIILFLAALNSVPRDIYESVELDGGRGSTVLFRITLPLITPSIFFIFVISIINSFKSFREAYILCGSMPHRSIYMLQHFMNNNFANMNYQRLSVGAILVFLVIFAIVLVTLRVRDRIGDHEL